MSRALRPIWRRIALLAVVGIAAVAVMQIESVQQVRARAYAAVESADAHHARGFLSCALPGMNIAQATTREGLRSMMERSSQRLGVRTPARIGQCLPELAALNAEIQRVRVLDKARGELAALQAATTDVVAAWESYQVFAENAPTDHVGVLPYIDAAAVAWSTYTHRRDALFGSLRPARSAP